MNPLYYLFYLMVTKLQKVGDYFSRLYINDNFLFKKISTNLLGLRNYADDDYTYFDAKGYYVENEQALTKLTNAILIGNTSYFPRLINVTNAQEGAITLSDGMIWFNTTINRIKTGISTSAYILALLETAQTFTQKQTFSNDIEMDTSDIAWGTDNNGDIGTDAKRPATSYLRELNVKGDIKLESDNGFDLFESNKRPSTTYLRELRLRLGEKLIFDDTTGKCYIIGVSANQIEFYIYDVKVIKLESHAVSLMRETRLSSGVDLILNNTSEIKYGMYNVLLLNNNSLVLGDIIMCPSLPGMTTTQRGARATRTCDLIYNSTLSALQYYISGWKTVLNLEDTQTIIGNKTFDCNVKLEHTIHLQVAETANVNRDTTPTVLGINSLLITNDGATTITNFDFGVEAQVIYLRFADANTTITDGTNIELSGGANKNFGAGDMCVLVLRSSVWYQTGGVI